MHVAYYAPAWPPAGIANGVVTYVAAMREHLMRTGHQVSVLTQDAVHLSDCSEITLFPGRSARASIWSRLKRRIDTSQGHLPLTGARMAAAYAHAAEAAAIDLVEMEESFGWSRAVQRALRRRGVPVVTRLHGPHFLKPKLPEAADAARRSHQRWLAEGRAIKDAIALTASTGAVLNAACAEYGRTRGDAEIIPNPVALGSENRCWTKEASDPDLILCVGRFDYFKGADTMLAAFAELLKRRPKSRLMMVGPDTGLEGVDGRLLPFAAYSEAHLHPDVRERIEFAGLRSPNEIGELRRRAFVTVVASRCETFAYAAVEAMAVGSPLIATTWPGSDDLLTDGVSGWRVPVGDASTLADRLYEVLAMPQRAAEVGRAARDHCRNAYALDTVGDRMMDFYQRVLNRHAPRT